MPLVLYLAGVHPGMIRRQKILAWLDSVNEMPATGRDLVLRNPTLALRRYMTALSAPALGSAFYGGMEGLALPYDSATTIA